MRDTIRGRLDDAVPPLPSCQGAFRSRKASTHVAVYIRRLQTNLCAPAETSMDLALLGNRALQVAVRRNLVCFPSQAPVFGKRPQRDLQWRLAVLYFIRGWSTREIALRYGLTRERCGQIISDWRIRAVNMGYIQDVTPEDTHELETLARWGEGIRESAHPPAA